MIFRRLHSVVVGLEQPAPESIMRWVRDLPPAEATDTPTIIWRRRSPHAEDHHVVVDRDGTIELFGSHHLLAVLQAALVERSSSLIHAGGLHIQGHGVLVVGSTGAGKTLVSLAALSRSGWELISDDLVVVDGDGRMFPYRTPISIKNHHLPLLPPGVRESLTGPARSSALLARLVRLPGVRATGRFLRRLLRDRSNPLSGWAHMVRTDFLAVPTTDLFPATKLCPTSRVELVVLLENDAIASMPNPTASEAAGVALESTYSNESMDTALDRYARDSVIDRDNHRRAAADIMASAFGSATVRVRCSLPAKGDIVDAQLHLANVIEEHVSSL